MSAKTTISDKVKQKIDQVIKDPTERKFLYELLERVIIYGKEAEPLKMKREFKLILDQHFPFMESKKND